MNMNKCMIEGCVNEAPHELTKYQGTENNKRNESTIRLCGKHWFEFVRNANSKLLENIDK